MQPLTPQPETIHIASCTEKMNKINAYIIAFLSMALVGCAASVEPPEEQATAIESASVEAEPAPEPAEEAIEYGSFTEEQLYQAIISELGAQRGQLEDAGENYLDLAIETRDLTIIRRAIQFASANGDVNALLQLGLLWAEESPDDPQPHLMLSMQFLEGGAFQQAISHMARVIDLGGDIDFSALSGRTGGLSQEERASLISNLQQLSREFTEQSSIHLALVQMLAQNGQFEEALAELDTVKETMEQIPNVVLLEAQILQNMDRNEQALRTMREGVRNFEDNKTLRLSYARLLIQNEEFAAAQAQFQILIQQDPQDWDTLYSIALLDSELENYDRAIASFERLISFDQRVDESQYSLAALYEEQGIVEKAIEHYRQVRIGTNNFLAAQQQATRLSIQLGELEQAHDWLAGLSRGQPRLEILFTTIESSLLIQADHLAEAEELLNTSLNRFPNETDLLFARVLYYDSINNQEGSEADLRQIILMLPEDSRALNHLGYMLANQTTRYQEALELVERAIAISPEDPAILDSLAWAQYKLGNYEDALLNLRKAFAAFPDHEVASHLGEVLWMMGRKDQADQVWQDALEVEPDSEIIKEAMDRLQAAR